MSVSPKVMWHASSLETLVQLCSRPIARLHDISLVLCRKKFKHSQAAATPHNAAWESAWHTQVPRQICGLAALSTCTDTSC